MEEEILNSYGQIHSQKIPFPASQQTRVFTKQFALALKNRVEQLMEEILLPENTLSYIHGNEFVYQREDSSLGSGGFEPHQALASIENESIVSNDLNAFLASIEELAQGLVLRMKKLMYQRIGEEAESVGNAVSFTDSGSYAISYLQMLEKIEFGVDKKGNVSFPQLHVPPGKAEQFQTALDAQGPEFRQRIDALVAEKISDALRRERERLAKFKSA